MNSEGGKICNQADRKGRQTSPERVLSRVNSMAVEFQAGNFLAFI
jgi:hypothetical protein